MKNEMEFLCKRCSEKISQFQKKTELNVKKHSTVFNLKETYIIIGLHAIKKAEMFNLSAEYEIKNIKKGKMIEVQNGMDQNEQKYIYKFICEDNREMHAVILRSPTKNLLLNIYNPRYDMSFKWDKKVEKRIYLNSMRNCCKHPEDNIKNYNKKHHGLRHPSYKYQERT